MPSPPAGAGTPDTCGWRPVGVTASVAGGAVLLIVALLFGRADVALLGVPALVAVLFSRTSPPAGSPSVDEGPAASAASGVVESTLRIGGADVARVRAVASGHRPTWVVVRLPKQGEREIGLRLSSARTGPQVTATADVQGGEGYWVHDVRSVGGSERLVLPTSVRLGHVPVPRRLRGLTGVRPSRRLGDGGELRDVHPFAPGDRLKRIDWRTTARRSPNLDTLYVRRSFADAEAVVMLVVDSRDDLGPDLRTWRGFSEQRMDEATSLDLARHAAASVASILVGAGDRVGLIDLGLDARPLPPASGRRHLRRVIHGLALARPRLLHLRTTVRPPQMPADALIYLFSTVLDEASIQLVRTWRSLGHPVVLIDTLPQVHPVADRHLAIAWRILRMERQVRLDLLAQEGVPIVRWAGEDRREAAARLEAIARGATQHGDWR